ncbi:hypothetical protein ACSBR2_012489 [Camellia fascicularis]
MRRGGSESGDFSWPIVISTKGASNPEALLAQRRHASRGLRIRRLFVANRDIHEGRSESGGFIGPTASCVEGAPNPETFRGQS